RSRLVLGRAYIRPEITQESAAVTFGVLHFGDHHVNGGVRRFQSEAAYRLMAGETAEAYERGDFAEVIRVLDRHFGESTYSLASLFRHEQRKVIKQLLHASIVAAQTAFHRI